MGLRIRGLVMVKSRIHATVHNEVAYAQTVFGKNEPNEKLNDFLQDDYFLEEM